MDVTTGSSYTDSDLDVSVANVTTASAGHDGNLSGVSAASNDTLTDASTELSNDESNGESTISSGSSPSVGNVTTSLSKLALKSVSSNVNDAVSQDESASDEEEDASDEEEVADEDEVADEEADYDEDDSFDEELIPEATHKITPRKSITIHESGEEGDGEVSHSEENDGEENNDADATMASMVSNEETEEDESEEEEAQLEAPPSPVVNKSMPESSKRPRESSTPMHPTKAQTTLKPKPDLAISNLAGDTRKPEMKKGIKKILKWNQLGKETRSAERAEKDRLQRLEEKLERFQQAFPREDPLESSILDFNAQKKKALVRIDDAFDPHLKPHQRKGIKFMYDCVIEDVNELEEDEYGSGCILAHTMGLGKTFQVIVFLHTILTNRFIEDYIARVLIIVPYNVIENWAQEFDKWFDKCGLTWQINIYEMRFAKTIPKRADLLKTWHKRGGILLISNALFRTTVTAGDAPKTDKRHRQVIREALLSPGPDLVLVDEGHLLKNDDSAFNKALSLIETNRRIVLTGTPLQNNLTEYFVMVNFIKPNLLGDKKEFRNRFQNPIEKGQHEDSDRFEVHEMKMRIHVLFEMLKGCIHRCDYNILVPYLQPKKEYVLCLKLTEPQIKMYSHYLKNFADKPTGEKKIGKNFLRDKQLLSLVWNHPALVHDYYVESTEKDKTNFATQIGTWYEPFVDMSDLYSIEHSCKFTLLFALLEACEKKGEKLVIFSQSLLTLNLIERMLKAKMKSYARENALDGLRYKEIRAKTGGVSHRWVADTDYYRIDGAVDSSDRSDVIDHFNNLKDTRGRLMLVSTKAGGIGTNLVGANHAIIFDASFNPAHDLQAIFRIYRLGQTRPVYIYRFTAYGTMEDRIYKRQIVKSSLSCRVLDEQQINRHYKKNDLSEMYRLDTEYDAERVLPMCPDSVLNDLLYECDPLIVSWHEHDTLLANKPEEDLSEEDRIAAWRDYEKARNGPATGAAAAEEAFNKQNKAQVVTGNNINGQALKPEPKGP